MSILLGTGQVHGDIVPMKTTHPDHMLGSNRTNVPSSLKDSTSFAEVLGSALGSVNQLEQEAAGLSQQMITDPDSVDAHDITIAMGKANLAVAITKAVTDGALQAYKEIINLG